jgi:hypothetical protein
VASTTATKATTTAAAAAAATSAETKQFASLFHFQVSGIL